MISFLISTSKQLQFFRIVSKSILPICIFFLCSCGNNSSSTGQTQGETDLLLSGRANLEDLIFLSLEHATSLHTSTEDLEARGSDAVVYQGKEGTWNICLEGETEFVNAELKDKTGETLFSLNQLHPCASTQLQDELVTLNVINTSPQFLHHFVFIETVSDNTQKEWTSKIRATQAITSREVPSRLTRANTGYRSAEVTLMNDTIADLDIQDTYLGRSSSWIRDEQPKIGDQLSQYQSMVLGSFTTDALSGVSAFITLSGLGDTPIRVAWELNSQGELSFSIDSNSKIMSDNRAESTGELNHRMWIGTLVSKY